MDKFENHSFLIGIKPDGKTENIENSIEKVADFICNEGTKGNLKITTPNGHLILNTFGTRINKCFDFNYFKTLRPVLIQKQMQSREHELSEDDTKETDEE